MRDVENPTKVYGINVMPIENFYTYVRPVTSGASKIYLQLTPPDNLQKARFEMIDANAESMENTVFRKEPESMRLVAEVLK